MGTDFPKDIVVDTQLLNSFNVGDPVNIRAFKADGHCYRWWSAIVEKVVKASDDSAGCLVLTSPAGHAVYGDRSWKSRFAIRYYYWFDRPYNLLEVYRASGVLVEIYLHISSPAELHFSALHPTELHYIDYELDVVFHAGKKSPHIADEDEFEEAIEKYGYTESLQQICRDATQTGLELVRTWRVNGVPEF
ncbi:MAG: DUF402 domain-containing protein [Chloroflexota bacterium]